MDGFIRTACEQCEQRAAHRTVIAVSVATGCASHETDTSPCCCIDKPNIREWTKRLGNAVLPDISLGNRTVPDGMLTFTRRVSSDARPTPSTLVQGHSPIAPAEIGKLSSVELRSTLAAQRIGPDRRQRRIARLQHWV